MYEFLLEPSNPTAAFSVANIAGSIFEFVNIVSFRWPRSNSVAFAD